MGIEFHVGLHMHILINLEKEELINRIFEILEKLDLEIDRFYIEKVHKSFNCYMANPMIAIQRDLDIVILKDKWLIMILWKKHYKV